MRADTHAVHASLELLGRRVGLISSREARTNPFAVRQDEDYSPRPDVLWSLPLTAEQKSALQRVCGVTFGVADGVPLVGVEVELTDPSTKVMQSDVINLVAVRAPLGLIVVSEASETGLYRRLTRVIRTLRTNVGSGFSTVMPVEAAWIPRLAALPLDAKPAPRAPTLPLRAPRGGERVPLNARARAVLRELGEAAGFVVVENFTPPLLTHLYDAEIERRREAPRYLYHPLEGIAKDARKAGEYFTASEIDLAWLLPLPRAIGQLIGGLLDLDPLLAQDDLAFPAMWDLLPLAGFEIETTSGKHASGSFVNLASHFMCGAVVVEDAARREALERVQRTYARQFSLENVSVWEMK